MSIPNSIAALLWGSGAALNAPSSGIDLITVNCNSTSWKTCQTASRIDNKNKKLTSETKAIAVSQAAAAIGVRLYTLRKRLFTGDRSMKRIILNLAISAAACLAIPSLGFAQGIQVLKDEWVASSVGLHRVERVFEIDDETGAVKINEFMSGKLDDFDDPAFVAIALEDVTVTAIGEISRNVIAVDEAERDSPRIYRFRAEKDKDTGDEIFRGTEILNAASEADFRFVTTIAVSSDGKKLWFNGYSKRKRRYELWTCELAPAEPDPLAEPGRCLNADPVISGSPQLTESVYLNGADIPNTFPDGSLKTDLLKGGLIGVAGRQVLFFNAEIGDNDSPRILVDVRDLSSVQNNTQILSAALARNTSYLTLALSTREIITIDLAGDSSAGEVPLEELDANSLLPGCEDDRSQVLRIRNLASSDEDTVSVVTDSTCQLMHIYATEQTSEPDGVTDTVATRLVVNPLVAPGLLSLSVGEGEFFVCEETECPLTIGYTALYDDKQTRTFLSRKVNNLCDPRVFDACEIDFPDKGIESNTGRLLINPQLPQDIQDSLAASNPPVNIYLPAHLFSTSRNGQFGALFVNADAVTRVTLHEALVDIGPLSENGMPELDVALAGDPDFPVDALPGHDLINVFNNDVVAYASDDFDAPAFDPPVGNAVDRRWEATPATIGRLNPTRQVYRGYSVVFYGLQDDLYMTSTRVDDPGPGDPPDPDYVPMGGILSLDGGSARVCDVTLTFGGGQVFTPQDEDVKGAYFMNLAACLFGDLRDLTLSDLVKSALAIESDRVALVQQLNILEDKLGKALSEAVPEPGPNAGNTNFQSTYVQLQSFENLVMTTRFTPSAPPDPSNLYQNDLLARIKVLEFTLIHRTETSIGLPPL